MPDGPGSRSEIDAPTGNVVLGLQTSHFLDEKALESFKRQTDLEESIWRTLPLFSGGLIAAGAIISSIAGFLPPFALSAFPELAYACVMASIGLFGMSMWWLWQVIKPREFQYLPDDTLVANFAESLTEFHGEQGLSGNDLDNAVASELRTYMREAYVGASKSTFGHNQERLSARSQVIICLLWGFVLAFSADGLETGHRLLDKKPPTEAAANGNEIPVRQPLAAQGGSGRATSGPSPNEDHPRRGMADQIQHSAPGSGQGLVGRQGLTATIPNPVRANPVRRPAR